MGMREYLRDKFTGSLIGTAVGDSLGAGREGSLGFREVREIGSRYTDDTHMMIGVAESLIACGGFHAQHMVKTFIENYTAEPWRGYGPGPPRIFRLVQAGRSWEQAAREIYPDGSFGNGSAMRVAPVGVLFHDDFDRLRAVAMESSRITHAHSLGMEGAFLQAAAIALAVREYDRPSDPAVFIRTLLAHTREGIYRGKLEAVSSLLERGEERARVVSELGHGIEACHSVPTAVFSFLANPDFEAAVVYAVSLGGDADTIGAMTGAIAGACFGIEGIPASWRRQVENGSYIENLGAQLWELKKRDGFGVPE